MRNRAIKISVSLPLNLLEKLDKITTYKGKSRSNYIAGAITQRIEGRKVDNMDDLPITYLTSQLLMNDETPEYLKRMIELFHEGIQ
jgi:metal-responsive CopG/Arc/MetJ family transcriptional regulator